MALERKTEFTYEDYQSLPPSETERYELIDGELIMVPAPSFTHQHVAGGLFVALDHHVRSRDLGVVLFAPFDVHLGKGVVEPDILYVSKERLHLVTEKEMIGAPDLVVEIFSPDSKARDQLSKRRLYFRHGVREYWLADTEARTVEVLCAAKKDFEVAGFYRYPETVKSRLLPELSIDLENVFGFRLGSAEE